jgi:hypothetical protein
MAIGLNTTDWEIQTMNTKKAQWFVSGRGFLLGMVLTPPTITHLLTLRRLKGETEEIMMNLGGIGRLAIVILQPNKTSTEY